MTSAAPRIRRNHEHPFKKSADFRAPLEGKDHCHIYVVDRDGTIDSYDNIPFTENARQITNEISSESEHKMEEANYFDNEDRLTLIQLPESADCLEPTGNPWYEHIPPMPKIFEDKLDGICTDCLCKRSILWKNLHRPEQHFDACFRYHDDESKTTVKNGRCFLKLYSMRVPFIAKQKVTFSMVHHVRVEGNKFVPSAATRNPNSKASTENKSLATPGTENKYDKKGRKKRRQRRREEMKTKAFDHENKEHLFAFVVGFESEHVGNLFINLLNRWQDIATDHKSLDYKKTTSTGMTPRLLAAAILSQYGAIVVESIIEVNTNLKECDNILSRSTNRNSTKEGESRKERIEASTDSIEKMSQKLVQMNIDLTGTRSTMHYLAESADIIVDKIQPFQKYLPARLNDWAGADEANLKALREALPELDSFKEEIRDNDKLMMVRKNMWQSKTDVKALQQHININVGMVRNLIAEGDKAIQFCFMEKADRDSRNMKIMAILTAIFLPGTYMAILLTTPMFSFDSKDGPTLLLLPFKIYWGFTGPVTLFFLIAATFMTDINWISWIKSWISWTRKLLSPRTWHNVRQSKQSPYNEGKGTPVETGASGMNGVIPTAAKKEDSEARTTEGSYVAKQGKDAYMGGDTLPRPVTATQGPKSSRK